MTLARIVVEVFWSPPAVLCDKVRVSLAQFGGGTVGGLLYRESGVSPIRFDLQNLSYPMAPEEGRFLRLVVAPEPYETSAVTLRANPAIDFQFSIASLVRPTSPEDQLPALSEEEPLLEGPRGHCL